MRIGRAEIAGGLAIVGLVVLLAVVFWPESSEPASVSTSASGATILGPPSPTPLATVEPSATEGPVESSPTPEPTTTATQAADPAELPDEARPAVALQVVNGGAPDGQAGATTRALAEQSFEPREPADAVANVDTTVVLHASGQGLAAAAVAGIVGVDADHVRQADAEDPNWAQYGADLDVLVVLGPPLP